MKSGQGRLLPRAREKKKRPGSGRFHFWGGDCLADQAIFTAVPLTATIIMPLVSPITS